VMFWAAPEKLFERTTLLVSKAMKVAITQIRMVLN
jgi:hypothetical protein